MPPSSMAGLVSPHLDINLPPALPVSRDLPADGARWLRGRRGHLSSSLRMSWGEEHGKEMESDTIASRVWGVNLLGPRSFRAVHFGTVLANQKAAHDFSIFKNQPIRSSHWLGFKILRYQLFAWKKID